MKNWNYIEGAKVGNTAHSDKVEVIKRLLHANWSVQEIYELLKKEGYEVDKNFIERMKTGNDTPWEYAHRKPKVINEDKTGAEEFFKKLSDDVKEREDKDDKEIKLVGNETYQHKLYPDKYVIIEGNNYKIVTDGKVEKSGVLTDAVLYGINQTYKKVGNFKTGKSALKPGDKVMSFGKKGTVKEVIGENTDNIYGEPLIKVEFEDGTTKTIGEHYMRKVGNKTTQVAQVGTVKILYDDKDNVYYTNVGGSIFNNPSFKTKEEAVKYTVQKNKAGNKVGNKKLKFTDKQDGLKEFVYDEENDKGYIYYDGKLVDTIPHAGQGWLNLIKQKAFSSGVMNKTGNAIGGGVQSETVLTEAKDGSQYWVEKTSKSGQYAQYNLYYTIGQGKRHAGVFKDKEAAADAGRRIIGNASSNEEYWKKQYIETARKKGISEKEIQEFVKKIEKEGPKGVMSTVKNSASDDKFAYVMREFDEGKLKTPDGKVVTDPAQAKAIAYSESKKTENGLARARKAMNKGVTMWKGNDSAYIKEDGTVSYLENNSFETDKDKFESQESAIKELSKQGYVKK